jgi:hypothetical protein
LSVNKKVMSIGTQDGKNLKLCDTVSSVTEVQYRNIYQEKALYNRLTNGISA